jgi:hypothetical protein
MEVIMIGQCISDCIDRLCADFVNCPNRLLTEDDMRLLLGNLLLEHFGNPQRTEDGDSSIALHSEVRWYGNGRLKYRSDLVVVDVSTLRVLKAGGLRLPSKGYVFNVPKAIIELKFRRPTGESDLAFLKSIEADRSKLKTIRSELAEQAPDIACWVVAFDKRADVSSLVPAGNGEYVVYRFSGSAEGSNKRRELPSLTSNSGTRPRDLT